MSFKVVSRIVLAAFALLALTGVPGSSGTASAAGSLDKINHIIVIYQENRSFDSLYGLGSSVPGRRRGALTRRDLLLQVTELDSWSRGAAAAQRRLAGGSARRGGRAAEPLKPARAGQGTAGQGELIALDDVRARAARQSQAPAAPEPVDVQLTFDLGDAPERTIASGLP